MNRLGLTLAGLIVLAGCDGGGGSTPVASQPPPTVQPDMLTATPQGLLRGKASGQGQQLIFALPNMHQQPLLISDGNVVYVRTKSATDDDIWTVRIDGTGDRAVVNTQHDEQPQAVQGPWVLYAKDTPVDNGFTRSVWSHNLNTGAQHLLTTDGTFVIVRFYGPDRVMLGGDLEIFSRTVTGTDLLSYIASPDPTSAFFSVRQITEHALIYRREAIGGTKLFTIPLAGGTATLLDDAQYDTNTSSAWAVGERVIYHRCKETCDVASVQTDGANRVVLTSNPANEAVQGVMGNQVIIRRNLGGNDHLIAVPVTGGPERLLMIMTDSEFAELTLDDLVIVRRPSGTWTVDLNGTLKQLGTVALDFGVLAVGQAVCGNRVEAVWCMPIDGSGPQVKIADTGRVIGAL